MQPPAGYFSPDYFTARDRFRDAAAKAGATLHALPLSARGPRSESLAIDIAWLGTASPRRVLLHSSGLHGVEGFAGSAIQLRFMEQVPALPADAAIVVVHILNPYGTSWLRRVNENNVDLNRNFRTGSYSGAPATYAALNRFLNPSTPPGFDLFLARAAYLILRHGMSALKQSVAGGQYEFPKGLFFGGKQIEDGPRQYEAFVRERLGMAEKAIVIDVHTGLGKFAEDSLLVESEDYARLRNIFGGRVVALQPNASPAYHVEGGLESMIFRVFAKSRPDFIGQEFGTYSPVKVLRALREENRWHHHGKGTLDHAVKKTLQQTFCPPDESWRAAVLQRGRELLEAAIAEITHDR